MEMGVVAAIIIIFIISRLPPRLSVCLSVSLPLPLLSHGLEAKLQ